MFTKVVVIAALVLFLYLFRYYLGPYLIRTFTTLRSVYSVGLYSLRGLELRWRNMQIYIHRVALGTSDGPPNQRRRFSLKITGLRIHVLKPTGVSGNDGHPPANPTENSGNKHNPPLAFATLRDMERHALLPPLGLAASILPIDFLHPIDVWCRKQLRTLAVSVFQTFIRTVPIILGAFDFQLESAQVTFAELEGASVKVKNVTVAGELRFLKNRDKADVKKANVKKAVEVSWGRRFRGSVNRTWNRAWGSRNGRFAVDVRIVDLMCYEALGQLEPDFPPTPVSARFDFSASGDRDLTTPIFAIPGQTTFTTSLEFSPGKWAISRHTIDVALNITEISLVADRLLLLAARIPKSFPMTQTPPRSPAPMPPLSPRSTTPPQSPFIGAISEFARLGRKPKPARQPLEGLDLFARMLRRTEVTLSKFKIQYSVSDAPFPNSPLSEYSFSSTAPTPKTDNRFTYTAVISRLFARVQISHPALNDLHRKHLGNVSGTLDPDIFSFACGLNSIDIHRELTFASVPAKVHLLHLDKVDAQSILMGWKLRMSSRVPVRGDPNDRFVAIEVNVKEFNVIEQLDILQDTLARFEREIPATDESPSESPSVPWMSRVLVDIPRICLDVNVYDIQARVACDGESEAFALDFATPCIYLHASHTYSAHVPQRVLNRTAKVIPVTEDIPLRSDFVATCGLMEPQVRVSFSTLRMGEDGSWIGTPLLGAKLTDRDEVNGDEPIIESTGLELQVRASCIGNIEDIDDAPARIPLASLITETNLVSDVIEIQLWSPRTISALRKFLSSLRPTAPSPSRPLAPPKALFERLPAGISVQVGVQCFKICLAARDLNPASELGLQRGLHLQTSLSLQYCHMQPRHAARSKHRFQNARSRDRLYLPENILMQAFSMANEATAEGEGAALLEVQAGKLTVRKVVGTEWAMEDPFEIQGEATEDVVRTPKWRTRVLIRRRRSAGDSMTVITDVGLVHVRLQIVDMYSALLSARTLQLLIPPKRSPQLSPTESSPVPTAPLRVDIRAQIMLLQLLLVYPLRQATFLRFHALTFDRQEPPAGTSILRFNTLSACVPSHVAEGRWEELVRLRYWSITLTEPSPTTPLAIAAVGDSGRLCIPSGYVFSDLILDINLTVKSMKQLVSIVQRDEYEDMGFPEPEAAKRVPNITVRLETLIIEASDAPFDSRLNLIWRTGREAQRKRLELEEGFEAKLAAIKAQATGEAASEIGQDWPFSGDHTIEIQAARQRLYEIHAAHWRRRINEASEYLASKEEHVLRHLRDVTHVHMSAPSPITLHTPIATPPLLRIVFRGLSLAISKPHFKESQLGDFLYENGAGLPRDTLFTLLIPMHIAFSVESAKVTLRDFPLPMLNIAPDTSAKGKGKAALLFDSEVVIAEEVGPPSTVDWVPCTLVEEDAEAWGSPAFVLNIPKTVMPVKSYADPTMTVTTPGITDFTWGVSYMPAIQDLMRVVETLSTPPRDSSPSVGFWDKLRLILHWRIKATFVGEVHLNVKGSRDPYHVLDDGAGFVLCWKGNTSILIGHQNDAQELIQVKGDQFVWAIPNFKRFQESPISVPHFDDAIQSDTQTHTGKAPLSGGSANFQKVVAKLNTGIVFGLGFTLERNCTDDCEKCDPHSTRRCRSFKFRPHYEVQLKPSTPHDPPNREDSFKGFRSDWIHFAVSLISVKDSAKQVGDMNSFHLSPKMFAHFFSWWALFDGVLSLPIRQGDLFPDARPQSKKFGRHLATLKYKLAVAPLSISHVYRQESRASWEKGETTCVGVKASLGALSADLHQRDEHIQVYRKGFNTVKLARSKRFYEAEVVLKDVNLKAMVGVFEEPNKKAYQLPEETRPSPPPPSYEDLTPVPLDNLAIDLDDFIETDWASLDQEPRIYMEQTASCPHFTWLKRTNAAASRQEVSMFGKEESHKCMIGTDQTVYQVQQQLTEARIRQLEAELDDLLTKLGDSRATQSRDSDNSIPSLDSQDDPMAEREVKLHRKLDLLRGLSKYLQQMDAQAAESSHTESSDGLDDGPTDPAFNMPHMAGREWAEFDNEYQVHCPQISLSNRTRNILLDYYYASRARRGFEYHMAARAVKFIRDQAKILAPQSPTTPTANRPPSPRNNLAHSAMHSLMKMLVSDQVHPTEEPELGFSADACDVEPERGWTDEVAVKKSHFCLLLKPQIVLSSELDEASVLIAVASSATFQTFGILDKEHVDDPVNGSIMNRSYVSLNALQVFAPARPKHLGGRWIRDKVPLEMFVDYRSEFQEFDKVIPSTDTTMQYDKFNRLRLNNKMNSTSLKVPLDEGCDHLKSHTDRFVVNVPRISVSANTHNFSVIYNIVTDLLLYTDPVHRAQVDNILELSYGFDWTDCASAAEVIASWQGKIRDLLQAERMLSLKYDNLSRDDRHDLLEINAQIFLLSEELGIFFETLQLSLSRNQALSSKTRVRTEDVSGVKLEASSGDVSWNMLDNEGKLIAKLSVRGIEYLWLSRSNGSVFNKVRIADLQALDGAPDALYPEMLVKYYHPESHPMVKANSFVRATWAVLAPISGISIIETFKVEMHPICLQLERRAGRRIMDYIFPHRKEGQNLTKGIGATMESHSAEHLPLTTQARLFAISPPLRTPPALDVPRGSFDHTDAPTGGGLLKPRFTLRRAGSSSNLAGDHLSPGDFTKPGLFRTRSSTNLVDSAEIRESRKGSKVSATSGDAAIMKARATQNRTFLTVSIASTVFMINYKRDNGGLSWPDLHGFKFTTPEFKYHNRTLSFEELVNQLKKDIYTYGWERKSELLREVITKTKFSTPKKAIEGGLASSKGIGPLSKVNRSMSTVGDSGASTPKARWPGVFGGSKSGSSASNSVHSSPGSTASTPSSTEATSLSITIPASRSSTEEQQSAATVRPTKMGGRQRVLSLFRKNTAPSPSSKSDSPPPPLPGRPSNGKRTSSHGRHSSLDSVMVGRDASVDLRRESVDTVIHESPEIMLRESVDDVLASPTSA